MSMTFGNPDYQTPHGGPPFHGWKNGFGFGKALGPGQYYLDPSQVKPLRFTPEGDRGLASNPFWRTKYELGQAAGLGIGSRPDYGNKDASIAPDNYGDVSPNLKVARRNVTRAGITIKHSFPTFDEKKKMNPNSGGPGPAKYNTSIPTGQSSWCYPTKVSSWTMLPRPALTSKELDGLKKPGPGDHEVRVPVGKNSPILHGTLYDIKIKGRLQAKDIEGLISPGPAKYFVPGPLDMYGLDRKIKNVKIPKTEIPRDYEHQLNGARRRFLGGKSASASALLGISESTASASAAAADPGVSGVSAAASSFSEQHVA
jgi:hypothetical protein